MAETWFISDTHFGHKNILEYEKEARPFKTVEEMNEYIIHRWNDVVRDEDTVYHLGDFCFGKDNIRLAGRLKGRKLLILGNHDAYDSRDYLLYFDKLYGAKFWEKCLLTHIPVNPANINGKRCVLNVHGHMHSKRVQCQSNKGFSLFYEDDQNYLNVSCEQNNLIPINADVIRQRVKELDND